VTLWLSTAICRRFQSVDRIGKGFDLPGAGEATGAQAGNNRLDLFIERTGAGDPHERDLREILVAQGKDFPLSEMGDKGVKAGVAGDDVKKRISSLAASSPGKTRYGNPSYWSHCQKFSDSRASRPSLAALPQTRPEITPTRSRQICP
jgi:hypothetical protein